MSLPKRLDASANLLDFLAWALLSLFGTRLFLVIFNYPTIGRGNWHIAHVLWGGVFMLLGIIFFLIFYGRSAFRYASIFSGIGWGLFIDEIGKYVTRDNNYWFRPAVIFIYISFVLLFFLYRILERKSSPSRSSQWHELFESCEEIVNDDLEVTEKKDILHKINKINSLSISPLEKKLLIDLRNLIISTPVKKDKYQFSLSKFIAVSLKTTYNRVFRKKLIFYGLFTYSLWYIGDKFFDTVKLLFNSDKLVILQNYYSHYDFFSRADVYMVSIKFIIEIAVAIFYFVALFYWINKKSLKGIRFYQWGLLVNIFLDSIFKFYFEQFSGVFSLIISLVLYEWLRNYKKERLRLIRLLPNNTGKVLK